MKEFRVPTRKLFNLFQAKASFLSPLKISENKNIFITNLQKMMIPPIEIYPPQYPLSSPPPTKIQKNS